MQTSGGASGTFLSDEHHRDLIVSALLHIHRSAGLRVLFDVVVGGSYVLEDTIVRTAEAPPGTNGPFGTFGREQSVKRNTAGGVGGLDMMIRVSRHLSIGPTVRLHIINRAKYPADNGFLELGENVLRAGVVTRVTF